MASPGKGILTARQKAANARLSTGPRTPQGKRHTRLNALRRVEILRAHAEGRKPCKNVEGMLRALCAKKPTMRGGLAMTSLDELLAAQEAADPAAATAVNPGGRLKLTKQTHQVVENKESTLVSFAGTKPVPSSFPADPDSPERQRAQEKRDPGDKQGVTHYGEKGSDSLPLRKRPPARRSAPGECGFRFSLFTSRFSSFRFPVSRVTGRLPDSEPRSPSLD